MSLVKVDFYTKTSEAWAIMLEEIRNAKHSIVIELYIFTIDSVGRQFIELLRQKVKEGVHIRILLDMVGSYSFYRSLMPQLMQEQGMEIRFFNPVKPWRITNFTSNLFRNHRKVLLVDGKVAHLGGVNIQEHMATWRDTHMRITGPIVENISQSFEDVWEHANKFLIKYSPFKTFVKHYDVLTNSPSFRHRYIYQNLISQIRNSKKYIYLTTPYFIPDVPLYRAMYIAARRGIDVRLLVPEVADHIFVNHARESYFTFALRAGIRIYIYTPTMMHAKTAVVDDTWAMAGSFNLDSLSFFFNHEANIASEDTLFINEIKNHFFEDLKHCREIKLEEWRKRPLRKKVLELVSWLFHGIM
ncbi:MAG: phospholipase D/transphosphatidylase, cardiolipin synthase [Candidatus Paceibacter sp.]|jgi:cardiolipin synthase|nr:phospholipase D/transphosphatidylase, cardiolipin synthase [Candidatus Paceibacter sp.]